MREIPKSIETERLILRPVQEADFKNFYAAFCDSFKALNLYYSPLWSKYSNIPDEQEMKGHHLRMIEEFISQKSFLFSIFSKQDQKFLGQGEIHHFDPSVPKGRLGYWIHTSEMGKGYASEVANILTQFGFDVLECQRLEIRNDTRNPSSGSIAKKVGYKFLTIFEKNKQGKKDDFWDLEIYAILKSDKFTKINLTYIN